MDTPNILIKEALQYAVNELNNGINPTEALKKSAEYYDLKYDFIQRVGEGLNTALHYNHFKVASDKAEEFPIADIPKVLKELYPDKEKTAAEFKSEHFPPVELFNPIPDLDKIYSNAKQKEAYIKISSAPKDVPTSLSDKTVFEKSAQYISELEKQASNAKIAKVGAKTNMEAVFFGIADGFRKDAGYRTSFGEFESQAFSKYGEKVLPYLDIFYKQANIKEERGVHDTGYKFFDECPELQKLDKFFKYSEEMVQTEKDAEDSDYNLKFEKDYIAEIYKSANCLKKKSENIDSPFDLTKIEEDGQDKYAGLLEEVFSKVREKALGDQTRKPKTDDVVMDNFERQAILQDLLLRDPILKKENPSDVIAAFEQIIRIAPAVGQNREVLRALLRQMVAGQALGPHAAAQLSDLQLGIMKHKMLQQGHPIK